MIHDPEGRIKKLPQWVQLIIARLERDLAAAKGEIAKTGANEGPVVVFPGGSFEKGIHFSEETQVRFVVTPENERSIGAYFDVVLTNGGLEIMGSESVIVKPRVSNVVEVRRE